MAIVYPGAEWDPLSTTQTQSRMSRHDIVCLHTMAGTFAGTDAMFHRDGYGGTESHFGLSGSGRLKQWQDLAHTADANNEGNHRVISIETADMGEGFPAWSGSDVPAWTQAQLDEIVKLVRWLCVRFEIPPTLVASSASGERGIAYHRQGIPGNFGPPYRGKTGPGELWTALPRGYGKPCPGDRRIRQLIEHVIPRVRGEQEDPMSALTDDQQLELLRLARTIDKRLADDGDIGRRSKETTIGVRALLARDGDVDEAEIVRLLVPQLLAGLPVEEMAALFAEAVPAEQAEAAAQAVLDALAVRLAN
jgi:hypothetical protein